MIAVARKHDHLAGVSIDKKQFSVEIVEDRPAAVARTVDVQNAAAVMSDR